MPAWRGRSRGGGSAGGSDRCCTKWSCLQQNIILITEWETSADKAIQEIKASRGKELAVLNEIYRMSRHFETVQRVSIQFR